MRPIVLTILLAVPVLLWAADEPTETQGNTVPAVQSLLQLSLKRAVEVAVSRQGNANILMADEAVHQAQARSAQARAAFLPDAEGAASEQSSIKSLGQLGVTKIPLPFGLKIPEVVGPYNIIDIRANGTETFDFSAIRRFQASRSGVRTAKSEQRNTDNAVATLVAKTYLAALHAEADYEAVHADVTLAQALLKQAETQKAAGTGTGIEITRARVQLSNEQQRELVSENERRKARFELLRAIGARLDTEIQLTDKLSYIPVETMTIDQARAEALRSREDLKAQQGHEDTARLTASAVTWERLPSITGFGDYGTTGAGGGSPLLPTRDYGLALRVPVFDGGRRDARRSEAVSQFREEQVRTRDLREQIELELREALDSLNSAKGQMQIAEEGLALADSELAQARRRYEAGVTNGIEVTDAQTRLERARDNQIAALFNYNLARIDLGQATGTVRAMTDLSTTNAPDPAPAPTRTVGLCESPEGDDAKMASNLTEGYCGSSGALWIGASLLLQLQ
jgi:outer membrane protein TolC